MGSETFLSNVTVLEIGERFAVGRCGALLAELGATVFVVEPDEAVAGRRHKWHDRSQATAGKISLSFNNGSLQDRELLSALMQRADVVITSSDTDGSMWEAMPGAISGYAVKCDITAFGSTGPLQGTPMTDALLQAYSGGMWVTGMSDGPPALSRCNYIDSLGATFAVSGILAALRVRRERGFAQNVEIALFDSATAVNTTFLSQYLAGGDPGRIGNRHVSMAPWNSYQTRDGWVVLCTGSNDQWRRVCEVIGQPALEADDRFDTPQKRVEKSRLVDNIVESWTRAHTTAECMARLGEQNLPCGPVYRKEDLFGDASLRAREMIVDAKDPCSSAIVHVAGSAFRGNRAKSASRRVIPAPGSGRTAAQACATAPRDAPPTHANPDGSILPLAGLRVIEIGTYTTAPLTARQLGAMGADVIKLEPPTGDPARRLPPLQSDHSVFFSLGNSDKRAVMLDLKTEQGLETFRELLKVADVFVENLRPGALKQLGLGPDALSELNPRLIYCSITGFGVSSPYASRTAMDTTVQAMSGIMDLTRMTEEAPPCKIGISVCDAMGGAFGLASILAALEFRDRHGKGQWIDLSMQDIAATLTEGSWNQPMPLAAIVQCSDRLIALDADLARVKSLIGDIRLMDGHADFSGPHQELFAIARTFGISGAAVQSISEAMNSEQAQARAFFASMSENNRTWTLLRSPLRLSRTPAKLRKAIGPAGSDTKETIEEWLATAT